MKKIIVALLALVIVPSMLFANGIFSGSVGLSVVDDRPINESMEGFSLKDIKVGPELKLDLLFLEFDSAAYVAIDKGEDTNFLISGTETVGLTFDILDVVKLGVGAGVGYTYDFNDKLFGFEGAGQIGVDYASFSDALADASVLGKLSVEAKLGSFTAGVSALWNPGICLRGLKNEAISFSDIKLGVSAGYSF